MKHRAYSGIDNKFGLGKCYFIEIYKDRFVEVMDVDFERDAIARFILEERKSRAKLIMLAKRYIDYWFENVKLERLI